MDEYIEVEGACIHNLKNVNVKIPKNKLTVITGVSGSGKSSLAFDVIYEEGKRRYLSFLDPMYSLNNTVAFKAIRKLSPTVAIEQCNRPLSNPRSTVATKTGIDTLLAMLFSEYGVWNDQELSGNTKSVESFQRYSPVGMCRECYGAGKKYTVDENMLFGDKTVSLHRVFGEESTKYQALYLFCKNHNISYKQSIGSLDEALLQMYKYGDRETNCFVGIIPWLINCYRKKAMSKNFDSAQFPFIKYADCPKCGGSGRGKTALVTTIEGKNIVELESMSIEEVLTFLSDSKLESSELLSNITARLKCLTDVNLGYISLSRSVPTLSGGELQRLSLANYICSDIDSIVFVFDEPTACLHTIEKRKLAAMLRRLVSRNNTVIVVEHDKEIINTADHIIDLGPYAGKDGGECLYQGSHEDYVDCKNSIISRCLYENEFVKSKNMHRFSDLSKAISVKNCSTHNLKNVSVKLPIGCLVGIAGVSGSGKSSLVSDTLVPKLKTMLKTDFISSDDKMFNDDHLSQVEVHGIKNIEKCYFVGQKPIGKNKTSCVATALGVFGRIRKMFSNISGIDEGMFSPNSIGRCPDCSGEGIIHYNVGQENSVDFECRTCGGSGFIKEALETEIDGKNIKAILDMEISQAMEFFKNRDKSIYRKLSTIKEFGLGYLKLGQKTSTLSGGEAQRLKLSCELGRSANIDGNIYIMDEPTTGLSMYDNEKLIDLFQKIVDKGGTVLVIEHNVEILSACDYIIELGPKGGKNGGYVIATGTPEDLQKDIRSIVGKFL